MIVSHQYRFIYIRCMKTASFSTELALSRVCGPDDVITPVGAADFAPVEEAETLRSQMGGHGPQNYLNPNGRLRFRPHMSASEVRLLVGEKVWNSYYKWCVERNPWDKAISLYYFRHRNPATRPPLRCFLESGFIQYAVNFYRYTIGGEVAVDRILRYEQLTTEFEQIAVQLDLPAEATRLPRTNAHRPDRRHYSSLYTPAERESVAEVFAEEIALHGYRYEEPAASNAPPQRTAS